MNTKPLVQMRRDRGTTQQELINALSEPGTSYNSTVAYHLERSPLHSMTVRSLDRYVEVVGGQVVFVAIFGDELFVITDPEEACRPPA